VGVKIKVSVVVYLIRAIALKIHIQSSPTIRHHLLFFRMTINAEFVGKEDLFVSKV
jgi:hypothetical protein